ncbi:MULTISPECIES: hypothetical protein [unclassified Exiguobacterium]|uniref:hypothetical protein n=1 Tax=unclassified Exiguobacterium TaxID=2644629 RepID=UPI001BE63B27|nr:MULTISPECIES: hypothetical protein [unclassified Exiguobacterium]
MNQKRTLTIFLVTVIFLTLISTVVLLYRFPGSYEFIYGAAAAIFAAISLYISGLSYEVAKEAQKDSARSADATELATKNAEDLLEDSKLASKATVESAQAANKALELTKLQFKQASDISRIENGSHLILQKREMYYPLEAPQIPIDETFLRDSLRDTQNLKKLLLTNTNKGAATNITLTYYLENADEFQARDIHAEYEGRQDKLNKRAYQKGLIFPTYQLKYTVNSHFREDKFVQGHYRIATVTLENYARGRVKGETITAKHGIARKDPRSIAFLKEGEEYWFTIPESFRVLCHQFFLERGLLQEKEWTLPNPLLLVRVEYNEPIYDKLGDLDAYNRVKEFEVTCSSNVKIIEKRRSEEQDPNKKHVLGCHFIIKTRLDEPISVVTAPQEELASEEELDGSTGPIEE